MGELFKKLKPDAGGRPPKENLPISGQVSQTRPAAAKAANIDRHLMQRSLEIAALPEKKFEQTISESIEQHGKVTIGALLKGS